jgi:predicted esterase
MVVVLGGSAGATFAVLRSHAPSAAATSNKMDPQTQPPDPPADWCAPGFEPVEGGGCIAASRMALKPQPLIVYLHGRYARDAAGEETDRQRRLGAHANARGFAVLALRGMLGACTAAELANWFCWPSNERNADAAPIFVEGWARALAAAEQRAGQSPERFLLGFSNGGYFAGLIASRGLLRVDAIVIAHGGPIEPVYAQGGKPPLLLLSADEDVAQDEMLRLDEDLTREHWPHDSDARDGGHGLSDEDIEAAVTFFSRAKEPIPLRPPLALHRAVHHARTVDANAEELTNDSDEAEAPQSATPQAPQDETPDEVASEY